MKIGKILGCAGIGMCVMMGSCFAFSDLPTTHWAFEKVTQMQEKGLISGFEDGTFRPSVAVNREQTASILTNAFDLKLKAGSANQFNDVPSTRWSKYAIDLASQYLPGYENEDGTFDFQPSEETSRIDVAKAIVKILNLEDTEADLSLLENFADKDTFKEEDKKYIALAVENKIMSGKDTGFDPYASLTRAEICTLVYNVFTNQAVTEEQNSEIVLTVNGEEVSVKDFELYFKLQRKLWELYMGSENIWNLDSDGDSLYNIAKNAVKEDIVLSRVKLQKAKEYQVALGEAEQKELEDYIQTEEAKKICEYYGITTAEMLRINTETAILSKFSDELFAKLDHTGHNHGDLNEKAQKVSYDVRHILFSTTGKTEAEAEEIRKTAEEVLNQVKAGEDFATLATKYSQDYGSAANGGLYQNIQKGQFVEEFENAALALNEGEMTDELVESSYGYHIIRLEKKNVQEVDLTEEEKNEIIMEDFDREAKKWVSESNVEVNETLYNKI
ncbi:MAG: peptidylprolyl isomerase [Clostridia bacterium]|nr:peptidylprolyl isomerase [Clostridia bacterium]